MTEEILRYLFGMYGFVLDVAIKRAASPVCYSLFNKFKLLILVFRFVGAMKDMGLCTMEILPRVLPLQ